MKNSKLTRRQLLKGTGAAVLGGGAAILSKNLLASEQMVDGVFMVAGTINRLLPPAALHIISTEVTQQDKTVEKAITIQLSDDAFLSRGHHGDVTLTDFVSGEKVVAEGEWEEDVFVATTLMSLCQMVEGEIVDRKNGRLHTTAGTVLVTSETMASDGDGFVAKSLDELVVGDQIGVLAWRNPATNEFTAMKLGVKN